MSRAITCCLAATLACALPAAAQKEPLRAAWFAPDEIGYAGTLHMSVRNLGVAPLEITALRLNGRSVGSVWRSDESFTEPDVRDRYLEISNEAVAWYRVFPNPVSPGGMTEIMIRLQPQACEEPIANVELVFADGATASARVALSRPTWRLEYIAVAPELRRLFVYCRISDPGVPEPLSVEVDGQRLPAHFERLFSGLRMARVDLPHRWEPGSYHSVAALTSDDMREVLVRALPNPPPLAIMGNLAEAHAREYAQHLFDVHIAFVPPREQFFQTLKKFGLQGAYISYRKTRPDEKKDEPIYYSDPAAVAALEGEPAIWAHFLEDEPDGRYHRTDLSHLQICRDVERANQVCRIMDSRHPTYLQMDHGSYPRNMYIWGQIPDYLCTHAYPLGGDILGRTADHVKHTAAASRPRPFIYLCEGYSKNANREFDPLEMHLEVFTALAHGAKSLQWYPAHSSRGLLEHPAMWDAVGRMNVLLHQALPLLSIGVPAEEPLVTGGDVEGSMIVCGDRALAVVLVNHAHRSTPEDFSLEPARDVSVRVRVPASMQVATAALVGVDGPVQIPIDVGAGTARFTVPEIAAGAIIVLPAKPGVLAEMRAVRAERLKRARAFDEG